MSTLSDLKNIEQHLRNANELAAKVRIERRESVQAIEKAKVLRDRSRGSAHWNATTLWMTACTQHDAISEALTVARAEVSREEQRLAERSRRYPGDEQLDAILRNLKVGTP